MIVNTIIIIHVSLNYSNSFYLKKDSLKSQASVLKSVMVSHQQLIGEVKSMLTTMAKVKLLSLMFTLSVCVC